MSVIKKVRPSAVSYYGQGLTRTTEILLVLQKIINITCRQRDSDLMKLSRWIRCLFSLSLDNDDSISLNCIQQVSQIATRRQGVSLPFVYLSLFVNQPPRTGLRIFRYP